jgi:hypothetical protein
VFEVKGEIPGGINYDDEPDGRGEERVKRREPVEGDVEAHIPRRHPRRVHGLAARCRPSPQNRESRERGESRPDRGGRSQPKNTGEKGRGRGQQSDDQRQKNGQHDFSICSPPPAGASSLRPNE